MRSSELLSDRAGKGWRVLWICWMTRNSRYLPTARMALAVLVNQLKELDRQVDAIERELAQIQRVNPMARLLSSIPGIGPITATALAATVPDPTMFRSG